MKRQVSEIGIGLLLTLTLAGSVEAMGLYVGGPSQPIGVSCDWTPETKVKLTKAKIVGQDHAYEFEGSCYSDSIQNLIPVKVQAVWKGASKQALEQVIVSAQGGGHIGTTTTCGDDPWITQASCSVSSHSNTTGYNFLSWSIPLTRGLTTLAEATAMSSAGGPPPPPPPPPPSLTPTIISPAENQIFWGFKAGFAVAPPTPQGFGCAVEIMWHKIDFLYPQQPGPRIALWEHHYASNRIAETSCPTAQLEVGGMGYYGAYRIKAAWLKPMPGGYTTLAWSEWRHFEMTPPPVAAPPPGGPTPSQPKPMPGAAPPLAHVVRPVLRLKLVSAQARGSSAVEILLSNPNQGGQPLDAAVELRLGRAVVGQGKASLRPGESRGIIIHGTPPPGTKGPVEVEVFVNNEKVGMAKLTATAR
jgi:hypothetical protein